MEFYIGTSGWQYKHWKDVFYPQGLKNTDWLSFYAQRFDTLEVNVTFYRDVKPSTYEKWYNTVPEDFLFSVKMSKFITHIKRLKVDGNSVNRFTENVHGLKEKLGVVLIQLPPAIKFDQSLIRDFFSLLDKKLCYTVEARHKSFINDKFFSILEENGVAWCIADSAGRYPYHETVTASFVYIRLHGSRRLYASDYSDNELKAWKDKILSWNRNFFVYFDNDFDGYAVKNAQKLQQLFSSITSNKHYV
jgi:uncharacterized protein YecE (DUF72 family)